MKALKRTMAGEYSRELSGKVYAAQKRISEMGYRTGGTPGYGFRRLLISADGARRQILQHGDRKAVQTDRVILVHGPEAELNTVREMYRMVIEERKTFAEITRKLNQKGVASVGGGRWYDEAVRRVLTHRKYCGDVVFGMRTAKLHSRDTPIPRERWVVSRGRHEPIIDRMTFEQAQAIIRQRTIYLTNEQLLEGARALLRKRGKLTQTMIDECPTLPSHQAYLSRFGTFRRLCQLLGYDKYEWVCKRAKARLYYQDLRREFMEDIVNSNAGEVRIERRPRKRSRLRLRDNTAVAVIICRSLPTPRRRWYVLRCPHESRRFAVLALLDQTSTKIERVYLAQGLMRVDFTLWEEDIPRIAAVEMTDGANLTTFIARLRAA
jgi:Recombinase